MTKDILRLELKDFRVIKEANIKLNGITLVSGINGCGKSTISKILYHLVEGINNYNDHVEKSFLFWRERYILAEPLIKCYRYLTDLKGDEDITSRLYKLRHSTEGLYTLFHSTKSLYESISKQISAIEEERIREILSEYTPEEKDKDITNSFDFIKERLDTLSQSIEQTKKERPNRIILDLLRNAFNHNISEDIYVTLWEQGGTTLSTQINRASSLLDVNKAIYIDSPFALNRLEDKPHLPWEQNPWLSLNQLLQTQSIDNLYNTELKDYDTILETEVLHGESSWDESKREYMFTREDGSKFNLLDCATGERSLSILQMLLKNGWLDKSTLLIIDEPEVHLHPQWVVEYARLIVLLNKHIGVKFFLASHNPDLVSAIKHISEKEKLGEALNFYLAEKSKDNYKFIYRELGQDIEPIFESFNIALDRIDAYGRTQEEY